MIVLFNKTILTVFAFTSVPFIMFCQSAFTLAILLLRRTNIQRPNKDILLTAVLNVANTFFGISAAGAINIAMFTALRRFSIFFTLMAQHYILGRRSTTEVFSAVVVMIFGSFVAAIDDLTFNPTGYMFIFVNNVLTTAAQIQTKKALANDATKVSVLFWTACMATVVTGANIAQFDPSSFHAWDSTAFQVAFAASVILGFVINYGSAWTIQENDALTLAIAGSTKSALMGLLVACGLFDHTYAFSKWNFIGLQISAGASLAYAFFSHKPPVEPTEPKEHDPNV